MKFGEYEVDRPNELFSGMVCFGMKDSGRYRISPCSRLMDAERAEMLRGALEKAILPNSNISIPDIFWIGKRPFSADYCGEEDVTVCPSSCFGILGPGHCRRIVLGAVSAVAALERAGIVHGNVSPDCFRLNMARDGFFSMRLVGLAHAGIRGELPPIRVSDPVWRAPMAQEDAERLSSVEDTYALGLCIHYWMTGELPIWCEASDRQSNLLSSQLQVMMARVVGMMLSPNPYNRPLPSAVLRILSEKFTIETATRYYRYRGEAFPENYQKDVLDALFREKPSLERDYAKRTETRTFW